MTLLNGEPIEVLIPNKAWTVGKGLTVIGTYATKEEFKLAYERYALLAYNDEYATEAVCFNYIPLPKEKKEYTYWYKYLWAEIRYQLRKIFKKSCS